jgi:GT2 family glycosyltransferase
VSGGEVESPSLAGGATERVFVIVPVHNRRHVTGRFVDCLCRQTWPRWTLVLVDDGSTDGTADMVREKIESAVVVRGRGDWWWAGSLQQGLDAVRGLKPNADDMLLICNDDVEFAEDFIATAVAALRMRPRTLLLAREKNAATGDIAETGVEADFRNLSFGIAADPARINCLSTRGLWLRWRDTGTIGGFHPRLLPHYLSDYEWTIRAHRRGLRCLTLPEVHAVYQPTGVSGHVDLSAPLGPMEFIRRSFSRKSRVNPVSWVVFVLLASDWRSMPFALFRLMRRMLREAWRQTFRSKGPAR